MDQEYVEFQANQIICLEYEDTYLYAELIQISTLRQLGWVRPLILVVGKYDDEDDESDRPKLYDLRGGSDLLWPITLFRLALDTEVIPLLTELENLDNDLLAMYNASKKLRDFAQAVWRGNPDAFGEMGMS